LAALPGRRGQQIRAIATGGAAYLTEDEGGGNFLNNGTSQPRVDLRLDQDLTSGGRLTYQGGYASTEGIIHTGIGPFDIQSGSYMGYGRVLYTKGALRIGAFANLVDADAPTLLRIDPDTLGRSSSTSRPRPTTSRSATPTFRGKHILTYGGNVR
jgi:hypothetical protein